MDDPNKQNSDPNTGLNSTQPTTDSPPQPTSTQIQSGPTWPSHIDNQTTQNQPPSFDQFNPQPTQTPTSAAFQPTPIQSEPTPAQPDSAPMQPNPAFDPTQQAPSAQPDPFTQTQPVAPEPSWPPAPEPAAATPQAGSNTSQSVMDALYAPSPPSAPPAQPGMPANEPMMVQNQEPMDQTTSQFGTPQQESPVPTFQPNLNQPVQQETIHDTTIPSSVSAAQQPLGTVGSSPMQPPATEEQPAGTSQFEAAPTDLSHLIGNSEPAPQEAYTQPAPTSDNLIVPPTQPTSPPTVETTTPPHSNKTKLILIILGVLVLLAVIAASAYFILGVGRQTETTSIPAVTENTPLTNPPTPAPATTSAVFQAPPATQSAGFGTLPTATNRPSAADLAKQRQQATSTALPR